MAARSTAIGFEDQVAGDLIRTGKPGRIVSVGWTFSERPTTCSPTWLKPCEAPCRIVCASEFSELRSLEAGISAPAGWAKGGAIYTGGRNDFASLDLLQRPEELARA